MKDRSFFFENKENRSNEGDNILDTKGFPYEVEDVNNVGSTHSVQNGVVKSVEVPRVDVRGPVGRSDMC